jgi:hypothetical protein
MIGWLATLLIRSIQDSYLAAFFLTVVAQFIRQELSVTARNVIAFIAATILLPVVRQAGSRFRQTTQMRK